jgi:hypothetical protein
MNRSTKLIAACMGILLLLIISTEPSRLPSALLVLPFLLILGLILLIFVTVLRWRGLPMAKSMRLGLIAASLPMLILVLQSLGQLTLRDLLTIVALFAITYFYLSRVTRQTSG